MAVPSSITDLSVTAASNSPAGTDPIGTTLDDFLRSIQAIMKQQFSTGTTVASSATITPLADGNYIQVTGVTGITAIGSTNSWNGRIVVLEFAGILTITHNGASLILPGAVNITTAAGDVLAFVQESSGNWRCVFYQPAGGNLTSAAIGVTVQAYDADTAKLDVAQTFRAVQKSTVTTDNDLTIDCSTAMDVVCTPTAGGALTLNNKAAGQKFEILFINNSNYAITLGANIKVQSTLLATISATGRYILAARCLDGTNIDLTCSGALA